MTDSVFNDLRVSTSKMLGYDPENLTPWQDARVNTVSMLRLEQDRRQCLKSPILLPVTFPQTAINVHMRWKCLCYSGFIALCTVMFNHRLFARLGAAIAEIEAFGDWNGRKP